MAKKNTKQKEVEEKTEQVVEIKEKETKGKKGGKTEAPKTFGVHLDMTPTELEKSFKLATNAVDTQFTNVFHAFLHEEEKLVTRRFSTGSIGMDIALGGEGLPYGRIIELWGPEGGGKTSNSLEIAWNMQRATGKAVVFIDLEHKLDKYLLKNWKGVGFLPNMTRYEEPYSGEDAFGLIENYLQSPATGVIILDSIAIVRSKDLLDSDDQSTHYGKQAKLIADNLPKLTGMASLNGVPIIFVNQVRADLEKTRARGRYKLRKPGGKMYDHCVCISLYVDKISGADSTISDGVRDYGHWCNVWVYKNHAGPTLFKEFKMFLYYGWGFDAVSELVDMGKNLGVIATNGAWLSINENWKAQGRDKFIDFARQNPEVEKYLWEEIRKGQTAHIDRSAYPELRPDQLTFEVDDEGIEIEIPGETEAVNE
jgi:recombination protein RecA